MKEYVSKIILEHISNLKKKIQVEKINHQIIEIGDYINVPEITSEIENHLHTDNDIQRYVIQTLINDSILVFCLAYSFKSVLLNSKFFIFV